VRNVGGLVPVVAKGPGPSILAPMYTTIVVIVLMGVDVNQPQVTVNGCIKTWSKTYCVIMRLRSLGHLK
jgi:hypothetical protein